MDYYKNFTNDRSSPHRTAYYYDGQLLYIDEVLSTAVDSCDLLEYIYSHDIDFVEGEGYYIVKPSDDADELFRLYSGVAEPIEEYTESGFVVTGYRLYV